MATYYFKAPLSGKVTGVGTYCTPPFDDECDPGSTTHGNCSGSDPKDVAAPADTNITFYGASGGSIKVRTYSAGCCSSCSTADYKNARHVDFYKFSNASGFIGTVFFAHVKNPKADGTYNQNQINVGKVPGGCCPNCTSGCYQGAHTHFARVGGSSVGIACCDDVVDGSTQIYSWNA